MTTLLHWTDLILSVFPIWAVAGGLPICGLLLAFFLRLVISKSLSIFRFNHFCQRIGLSEFLRKGEVASAPSQLVGQGFFWVILLLTLLMWSHVLHLGVLESFYRQMRSVLSNFLGAFMILAMGFPVVVFFSNFLRTVIRNTGMPYAVVLAKFVKWSGWLLILMIAGEQIQFGKSIVGPTYHIILAAIAFAAALAFGLGCKDLARQAMEKLIRNLKENYRDRGGSDLEG